VAPPAFAVAVFKIGDDGRREPAAETTAFLVNLLVRNGLVAQAAPPVAGDLPESIVEAALAGARVGDVHIHGEVRTLGRETQVRLVAVDVKKGKQIDNFGNQGASENVPAVIQKTAEELLRSVETYWK
jgi:hypothetical protein